MKKRIQLGVLLLAQLSAAQTAQLKLPCAYSGAILRDENGKMVSFNSPEMKARATRKVDVSVELMGKVDFKATFIFDVLVGPTGNVICLKRVSGFPAADAEVEKSLRQWKFKPAEMNGRPVATTGTMQFYLCNIDCGQAGRSITLLN